LSNFIQSRGGLLHDVVVLVNAGRNKSLIADEKTVRLLDESFTMTSSKSSELNQARLVPMKPVTSLVSDRLTKSEIVSLRQSKKSITDYVQKAFPVRCKAVLDEFNQAR
jgi:hypothetical protein